jgi:hypothetical protein
MATSRVTVVCTCGGDKFDMPKNPKASDTIRCTKCGEEGLCGDVMSQTISALEKHLTDAVARKPGSQA